MRTPLQILEELGAPTNSYIYTIPYFNDRPDYSPAEYVNLITEILDLRNKPSFENPKEPRIFFLYTVQETLKALQSGCVPDMDKLWSDIQSKAKNHINQYPWVTKDYTKEETDEDGNVRIKKGDRKKQSETTFLENVGKGLSRQDWIKLFMSEVGLTKAGASTYYANMKKKHNKT